MDAREFREKSCKTIGTSLLEISAHGKRREVSRQRDLIAALAIERWAISAKAQSELLERRPESIAVAEVLPDLLLDGDFCEDGRQRTALTAKCVIE